MRIALTFPPPWHVQRLPGGRGVAELRGADDKPDVSVDIGPLELLPDEQQPWIEQRLRQNLPPGARLQAGKPFHRSTKCGWPMRLVDAKVLGAGDVLVEERLCVAFAFLEHAATVLVRATEHAKLEAAAPSILSILDDARPDWRGAPACMADVWDLEPIRRPTPRARPLPTPLDGNDLADALVQVDRAIAERPAAAPAHLARGKILDALDRRAEALADYQAAAALDPSSAEPRFFAGDALAALGRIDEAVGEWERALEIDPGHAGAAYNIGQASYNRGDFERALACFQRAYEIDPGDFLGYRKVVQSLHALGRHAEGQAAGERLRQLWRSSRDPRAAFIHEYVFDQFLAGGARVHAVETLRPTDPSFYAIYSFRVVDEGDQSLGPVVLVETSDFARRAGTPYVLGVRHRGQYRAVGTSATLPPYPDLKKTATKLLLEAMAS